MPFKDKDTASHRLQTLKHSLVRSLECPTHASSHMSTHNSQQIAQNRHGAGDQVTFLLSKYYDMSYMF